jgi:hypothetical protein
MAPELQTGCIRDRCDLGDAKKAPDQGRLKCEVLGEQAKYLLWRKLETVAHIYAPSIVEARNLVHGSKETSKSDREVVAQLVGNLCNCRKTCAETRYAET